MPSAPIPKSKPAPVGRASAPIVVAATTRGTAAPCSSQRDAAVARGGRAAARPAPRWHAARRRRGLRRARSRPRARRQRQARERRRAAKFAADDGAAGALPARSRHRPPGASRCVRGHRRHCGEAYVPPLVQRLQAGASGATVVKNLRPRKLAVSLARARARARGPGARRARVWRRARARGRRAAGAVVARRPGRSAARPGRPVARTRGLSAPTPRARRGARCRRRRVAGISV